jgi:hypothetical protein
MLPGTPMWRPVVVVAMSGPPGWSRAVVGRLSREMNDPTRGLASMS